MDAKITGFENLGQRAIADSMREFQRLEREKAESQMAIGYYKRLREFVENFQRPLDHEHEAWMHVGGVTVRPDHIGFSNPSLIVFKGELESGEPFLLVEHVSQLSVLVYAVKREHPEQPKKPIGFGPAPGDAG